MTHQVFNWALAGTVSVAAHVGAAFGLMLIVDPDPVPNQPTPETELQLSAYQVQRTEAEATAPDAEAITSGDATGRAVGQNAIPTSKARATDLQPTALAAVAETGATASLVALPADTITSSSEESVTTVSASTIESAPVVATAAPAEVATANVLPTATLASSITPVASVSALQPQTVTATAAAAPSQATQTVQPTLAAMPPVAPPSTAAQTKTPEPIAASPVTPKVTSGRASLAFAPADGGPIDPVSLAAFQSFMEPGNLQDAAADVRDGIAGTLSAVPCSRLQVIFDPTDNSLQMIGHVPEQELRGSVLAAMQDKMGADIPVRDSLLVLPRPQCGALTGIADVGLPQSTDQITNPLLVGENTQVREFGYVEGQPLVLGLQGADYDAYVYVDYFDADGNVIHLYPNQFTPHALTPAKAALQIGSPTPLAPGDPGLFIQVGPPFGQEIAVAFAASDPLYEGVRPLVEPADAYLEWLQQQVTNARDTYPEFKGEWVYFFITTSAN